MCNTFKTGTLITFNFYATRGTLIFIADFSIVSKSTVKDCKDCENYGNRKQVFP